jgi:hypothetical protein
MLHPLEPVHDTACLSPGPLQRAMSCRQASRSMSVAPESEPSRCMSVAPESEDDCRSLSMAPESEAPAKEWVHSLCDSPVHAAIEVDSTLRDRAYMFYMHDRRGGLGPMMPDPVRYTRKQHRRPPVPFTRSSQERILSGCGLTPPDAAVEESSGEDTYEILIDLLQPDSYYRPRTAAGEKKRKHDELLEEGEIPPSSATQEEEVPESPVPVTQPLDA